jgi:hypothetical protein
MNDKSFTSILDRPANEIERPKPLPVGTYNTMLQGMPRFDKSRQKQTPFVEFTHKILSADEDVDQDDLTAYLTSKDGTVRSLSDVTVKNVYYITEGSAFMLQDFLRNCGFDVDAEDAPPMRQLIEETPGRQVKITIRHEASQDGQSVFARVAGTSVAE